MKKISIAYSEFILKGEGGMRPPPRLRQAELPFYLGSGISNGNEDGWKIEI